MLLLTVAFVELVLCWVIWSLAFVRAKKQAGNQKKVVRARASLWGIALQGSGFALVWTYARPRGFEKSSILLIISMILGPPSVALAWWATRHLGKQWRYEAALSDDHDLIQTGPYSWVRHPIYASMFGMLLATGACQAWWPMFTGGVIVFLIGTEVRVRAEERLLSDRFKDVFVAYRSRVRAYIPFVR
jgi:protein-S-isoprenylcysteine O-methyltransferase Ste14